MIPYFHEIMLLLSLTKPEALAGDERTLIFVRNLLRMKHHSLPCTDGPEGFACS